MNIAVIAICRTPIPSSALSDDPVPFSQTKNGIASQNTGEIRKNGANKKPGHFPGDLPRHGKGESARHKEKLNAASALIVNR